VGLRLYVKAFRGFSCRSTNSGKRPFAARRPEFFLVPFILTLSRATNERAGDYEIKPSRANQLDGSAGSDIGETEKQIENTASLRAKLACQSLTIFK